MVRVTKSVPLYDTLGGPGAVNFILDHAEVDVVFGQDKKVKRATESGVYIYSTVMLIVCFTSIKEEEKNKTYSMGIKSYVWNEFLHMVMYLLASFLSFFFAFQVKFLGSQVQVFRMEDTSSKSKHTTFDPQHPSLNQMGEASFSTLNSGIQLPSPVTSASPSDEAAAMTLQKVYRGHRARRLLADSAVAEDLWWQAIDCAKLNQRTVSFFNHEKPESPASRWNRISLNASKVGKGLSQDCEAYKLAFEHWIEAIDPRHRYGQSLHIYYEEWRKADSGQPFLYWLDVGDGKEVDLKECPRSKLQQQCIKYLGPQERENYEYIIVEGKFIHRQTQLLLDIEKGERWIFVMSPCKKLYAGKKKKGNFHHSSFLAGGVTFVAGTLDVENGVLKTISPFSGHYRPTEETLESFLLFLKENGVDLDTVKVIRVFEDLYPSYRT